MKGSQTRRAELGAASVAAFLLGVTPLPSAASDPATDVEIRETTQTELYAAWDSCGGTAEPGDSCTLSAAVAVLSQSREEDPPVSFLDFAYARYEVAEDGERVWDHANRWFGVGPAEITVARDLSAATATADVEVVLCGDGSIECVEGTREVEVTWTATSKADTSREHTVIHAGIRFHASHGSGQERQAVAGGSLDGDALGVSEEALISRRDGRGIHLTRHAAAAGLGHVDFPLWFAATGGSDTELATESTTCSEARTPGDTCTVTLVSAYDSTFSGDYESGMWVRRFELRLGEDHEFHEIGRLEAAAPEAQLRVNRRADAGTADAIVERQLCESSEPAPDGPPPPPDEDPPPIRCRIESHTVSVSWTAIGRPMRTHSVRLVDDGQTRKRVREAFDWSPATTIGSFDGEHIGVSEWAVTGVRKAP